MWYLHLLLACQPTVSPTPPGASEPAVTEIITAAGGRVAAEEVWIDVPPGAVVAPVAITLTPTTPPAGATAWSAAVDFGPDGLVFRVPVTVGFPLDGDHPDAVVWWTDDATADGWTALPTEIVDGAALATVAHFSAGFAGPAGPPPGGSDTAASTSADTGAGAGTGSGDTSASGPGPGGGFTPTDTADSDVPDPDTGAPGPALPETGCYDCADTGDTDVVVARCPPGEILDCTGTCVEDTRRDGVCDPWLACPRFRLDGGDCQAPGVPAACPPGEVKGCWDTCAPESALGDGTCDPVFECPRRDWDRGDCAAPTGRSLTGFVVIDEPSDVAALAGVTSIDGELRIVVGAPDEVILPDLEAVTAISWGTNVERVELPALRAVSDDLFVGASALSAPRLRTVGGRVRFTGGRSLFPPTAFSVALPALRHVGDGVVIEGLTSAHTLTALDLSSLETVGLSLRLVDLTTGDVDLPALRQVGRDLGLSRGAAGVVRAPLLASVDGVVTCANMTIAGLALPALARAGAVGVANCGAPAVDLTALASVGELRQHDAIALALPALTEVTALVDAVGGGSLVAPHLTSVGELVVLPPLGGGPLAEIDLPALTRADRVVVDGDGGTVTLPALASAAMVRAVGHGTLALPALIEADEVDATVAVVEAPALSRARRVSMVVRDVAVALPALAAADEVRVRGALDVDLSALADARDVDLTGAGTALAPSLGAVDRLSLVGFDEVRLTALASVGALVVRGTEAVRTPSLVTLGEADLSGVLELDAPALATAGDLYASVPGDARWGLSSLRSMGWWELQGAGGIALDLPALVTARALNLRGIGPVGAWELPSLVDAGSLVLAEAADLTALRLPALTAVDLLEITEIEHGRYELVETGALVAPAATDDFDLDLPALSVVRRLDLHHDRRFARVVLPAVDDVTERLTLADLPGLHTLSLPALVAQSAPGWIDLMWLPALADLGLPQWTVGGRLGIRGCGLVALSLPRLEALTDRLVVQDDERLGVLDLPQLGQVAMVDVQRSSLDHLGLDGLERAGQLLLRDLPGITELSWPALRAVERVILIEDLPELRSIDAPRLASAPAVHVASCPSLFDCAWGDDVGGTVMASYGVVDVGDCPR